MLADGITCSAQLDRCMPTQHVGLVTIIAVLQITGLAGHLSHDEHGLHRGRGCGQALTKPDQKTAVD